MDDNEVRPERRSGRRHVIGTVPVISVLVGGVTALMLVVPDRGIRRGRGAPPPPGR